jgi:hypothetical protein
MVAAIQRLPKQWCLIVLLWMMDGMALTAGLIQSTWKPVGGGI